MNKELRKSLIEKYLNAETDAMQERMLAEWFATHDAEPEEQSFAKLILAEHPEAEYESAEREFDRMTVSRRKRSKLLAWACGAIVCLTVIAWSVLSDSRKVSRFNGLEIAQGIEHIMSLDMEGVESVTAVPKGNDVIITALMHDGTKYSYIMSKDGGTSAISITAMN